MRNFWLVSCFLISVSVVAGAQTPVGGPTAPPPIPDQISSVNQAKNPGFETGMLANWSANNGCITVVSSQHHSGSYAAQFASCARGATLTQNVTVPSWGSGSPAQYPEALAISFWVKTDANFNGSVGFVFRWLKGYWSAGSGYVPAFWNNNKGTTIVFANEPWTKYTVYIMLDPTAVSGSATALTVGFNMVNNGRSPAGNLWLDDVTFAWCWSSVRTFLTYPNYKGLLWDDKSQIITGLTELTPKVGTTSATSLAIKVGSAAGCASPITVDTISSPALFDPTKAYPQVQKWAIDTASLGLRTDTAYYICTTATWSDATTTTYPDFMVVPFNHALRAKFGNYVDADGPWVHKGNRQVAWGTFDNWSGKYRTGSGLHTTWCSPSQSPASNCFVYNIQSFGNWSPSVIPGIPGLTYEAPLATSGLMADYAANGFTWVEDPASTYSNIDPTLHGANQLTPLLEALDQYGVANSQIMNSYWGSIATSKLTGGAPSSPRLSEVSGAGTFTSGTYVFVQITGLGSPGGSGAWGQMGETQPTRAVSLQIVKSNDSVGVTLPPCLSSAARVPASQTYRWAGFNVYAATNSTNTPPASSSFYIQNFGGPVACGGSFTFGSIAQPGQADKYGPSPHPPTSDTTTNAGFNLGAYTDWEDWQQFAYAQSVLDARKGNHAQGAAAEYVFDEPVLNWLGDGYYFVDAQREWAPDVLTWATNSDNRTNRYWRDLFDVISSDPYGYNWVNSDEVYAGGTDTRTAYMPGQNNVITKFHAGVGLVDYWADFNGRTTYGARPEINVIALLEDNGIYGYSYPEMRRQYYKAMIGCQAWGGLGCGVLSYGWVEMEYFVFEGGGSNTYMENYQALKEIEALTPEWLATTADTSVLSIGTGKVDGASGLNVINRNTGSGPGLVLSNVKIGTSVSTVCAGGYTNSTVYPFGPVRFVTKQMANGTQYIIATNLCSAPSNFDVTFTLSHPPPDAVVELYGTDDPPAGSPEDPNGQYGNGTPANPKPHPRTFALTRNAFTDSWRDEDVHVYVVEPAPLGFCGKR
jgi:hypothetical protein